MQMSAHPVNHRQWSEGPVSMGSQTADKLTGRSSAAALHTHHGMAVKLGHCHVVPFSQKIRCSSSGTENTRLPCFSRQGSSVRVIEDRDKVISAMTAALWECEWLTPDFVKTVLRLDNMRRIKAASLSVLNIIRAGVAYLQNTAIAFMFS